MRGFISLIVVLAAVQVVTWAAWARQDSPPAPAGDKLDQADLEKLLGPIALYPDTLLANVLAASIYPDEITQAAAFVNKDTKPEAIDQQSWEPSVKAVAKVPDVLKMLAESPDWTAALGQAYMIQSQDVMAAIQSLRDKAKSTGALQSGEYQTVVEQGDTIVIEPAQPQVVYVPDYDPEVVYVEHHDDSDALLGGLIGFGVGVAVGAAFDDVDCDWHGGGICWGGGWDNDVDVDVDVGDVNIEGRDVNRERNVNRETNINNTNINNARMGAEGQPWKPNADKVQRSSNGEGVATNQLAEFKGAGSANAADRPAANRASIPKGTGQAAPGTREARAARTPGAPSGGVGSPRSPGDTGNRSPGDTGNIGGDRGGGGTTPPAARSGDRAGGDRVDTRQQPTPHSSGSASAGGARSAGTSGSGRSVPQPKSAANPPSQRQPSGFDPSSGSKQAMNRGSGSRASAGGAKGGGGGGGGRGGGGGGGRGGRR